MSQKTLKLGKLSNIRVTTRSASYDITSLVVQIEVTESIFKSFISGKLMVNEPASVSIFKGKKIPTDFSSKIDFSFAGLEDDGNSPQKEIKIKGDDYIIYKILPSSQYGYTQQAEVYFAHKSLFKNEGSVMSRSFKKKKISEIVKEIGSSKLQLQWNDVEETDKKFNFVLPYRTPVSQMLFLTPYGRSNENPNNVNYVFYQNIEGKHNFVSIGKLMSQQSSFGTKNDGFYVGLNRGEDFYSARRSILSFSTRESNQFQNALNGMHSSSVMTLDCLSKIWSGSTFFLPKIWEKQSHISNKPIVDSGSEFYDIVNGAFTQRFYAKSRHSHCCKEHKNGNNKIGGEDDWLTKRISSMEQLNQLSINFFVTGNSDFNKLSAGKTIMISRPQFDDKEGSDIINTGKFLVTTIKHTIYKASGDMYQYGCDITALKDSIGEE